MLKHPYLAKLEESDLSAALDYIEGVGLHGDMILNARI
jgi:hypothetical protein